MSSSKQSKSKVALAAIAAATGLALASTASFAGDYSHTCRSVDGQYVMQDEVLQTAQDERSGNSRSLRYRVEEKIVSSKTQG